MTKAFDDQLVVVKTLGGKLKSLAKGRLESDIHHAKDGVDKEYWACKEQLTQANHKLDSLR